MKLALRYELPSDATTLHDVSAWAIETRLVSRYAHGGIVIGDSLYHSNGKHGVHVEHNPDLTGWVLIDLGDAGDARALDLFSGVEGAGYDFFSLSAFIIPGSSDSRRYYCFELCFYLMTGRNPRERVTPEALLMVALHMDGVLLNEPPALLSVPAR